jgi:hypothetical protein
MTTKCRLGSVHGDGGNSEPASLLARATGGRRRGMQVGTPPIAGPIIARRRGAARRASASARIPDGAALQSRLERFCDLVRCGGRDRATCRPGNRAVLSQRRRGTAQRRRAGPLRRRHRRPAPSARSRFASRRSAGESRSPGCSPKRPGRTSRPAAAARPTGAYGDRLPGDLAGQRDRALLLLMGRWAQASHAGRSRRRAAALRRTCWRSACSKRGAPRRAACARSARCSNGWSIGTSPWGRGVA